MPKTINVKARKQDKVGALHEQAYVSRAIRYSTIGKKTVVNMASADTGVSKAVLTGFYNALEKQVEQMVCNGHTIYWPGIGYLRLAINAKAVAAKENISANLIRRVKLQLRPSDELRDELKSVNFEVVDIDDGEE